MFALTKHVNMIRVFVYIDKEQNYHC